MTTIGESTFRPDQSIPDLSGRVILVTGGTSGLGAESVFQIAQHHPATIYFTGRGATSAQGVIDRAKSAVPDANIVFVACDLTSLASVKAAAERVLAETDRLDILMCNAGIMAAPLGLTQDGYELQFGVNHLGHALLIQKLLPTLRRTATLPGADVRIVILTSHGFRGHPSGGIRFDTLRTTQDLGPGGPWLRYGQSKLANLIYARELARRVPELTTIAVHPGVVGTGLAEHLTGVQACLLRMATLVVGLLTPEQGAYTQLWAAFADRAEMTSGKMYEPVGVLTQLNAKAQDEELAQALWNWTEDALEGY